MTQPSAPAHDVFISYSSLDKPIADAVCATLEARRIRCWIAPRDPLPGIPYAEQLTDAIDQSRLLVLVLSSHSNQSGQVMREVEEAVTRGLPIVPLRIEDVELSKALRHFLKAVHWLDALTPPVEQHLNRLADTVRVLLSLSGTEDSRLAGPAVAAPRPGRDEPGAMPGEKKPGATPPPRSMGRKYISLQATLGRVGCNLSVMLGLMVALGLGWLATMRLGARPPVVVVEVNEPNPDVYVDGEKMTVSWDKGGKKAEIRVRPGTHKVEVKKDGFTAYGEEVTLEGGGQQLLAAKLEKAQPPPSAAPPRTNPAPPIQQPTSPPQELTNSIGMKLVLIPAGTFRMGSPNDEAGRFDNEGPQHEVKITRPFYLGAHEVTVGQFGTFVRDTSYQTDAEKDGKGGWGFNARAGKFEQKPEYTWRNPGFAQIDEHPVVNVSWNDAVAFCDWLSMKEGKTYGLPTEAQWEYSCRAGSGTRFCFGNDDGELGQYAWYAANSARKTHPVGEKKANAWGLFDMHGNAWEWCQDWYAKDYYQESPTQDPTGPSAGASRVVRGGSWFCGPRGCRAAFRLYFAPSYRRDFIGFRVVCVR